MAIFDDGHDYHEMEFTSGHRAGSKDNTNEARMTAIRKYSKIAKGWKVCRATLIEGDLYGQLLHKANRKRR